MTDNREIEDGAEQPNGEEAEQANADDTAAPVDDLFLSPDDSEGEEEVVYDPSAPVPANEAVAAPAEASQPTAAAPVAMDGASGERIAELEAERDDYKNRMMRVAADLENFRKRTLREKEDLRRFGIDKVVLELLPVIDNLERALDHAEKASEPSSIVDGVRMVHRQFISALEKHGVKAFESKGTPFDPQRHEAIQQIETQEHETGTVLEEYQKGYFLHERLIRPALVVVARRSESAPAPEEPRDHEASPEEPEQAADSGIDEPTENSESSDGSEGSDESTVS